MRIYEILFRQSKEERKKQYLYRLLQYSLYEEMIDEI